MPEDRSLDEFAEAGSEEPAADEESTEFEDARPAGEDAHDDAARLDDAPSDGPATSTAAWTAAGAGCQRCGARVSRRWRDDGDLVCAECKEW